MPIILSNSIRLEPPTKIHKGTKKYTIVFITGNPGLIEYYRSFLTHLHTLLATTAPQKKGVVYSICGSSLVGFEIPEDNVSTGDKKRAWSKLGVKSEPPFNLGAVIDAAEKNILLGCGQDDRVIIVGHSVGAYIALEIIQRHRKRLESVGKATLEGEPRIVGGICLFPTVTHIGESPRGKILTVSISFLCHFQSIYA
jgi:pimeloyl-ACP methyl ester carboxylesterase